MGRHAEPSGAAPDRQAPSPSPAIAPPQNLWSTGPVTDPNLFAVTPSPTPTNPVEQGIVPSSRPVTPVRPRVRPAPLHPLTAADGTPSAGSASPSEPGSISRFDVVAAPAAARPGAHDDRTARRQRPGLRRKRGRGRVLTGAVCGLALLGAVSAATLLPVHAGAAEAAVCATPAATASKTRWATTVALYKQLWPAERTAMRKWLQANRHEVPGITDPACVSTATGLHGSTTSTSTQSRWAATLAFYKQLSPAERGQMRSWLQSHGYKVPGVTAPLTAAGATPPQSSASPSSATPSTAIPTHSSIPAAVASASTGAVPPSSTHPASSSPASPSSTAATGTTQSFRAAIAAAKGGPVDLPAGVFSFSDFGADKLGADLKWQNLKGAGSAVTTITMVPHSSTKAGTVPTAPGSNNFLALLRVAEASPVVSGFTLKATDQGHLYSGLNIDYNQNARISDVRVVGVPGNFDSPPGETFAINDHATNGSVYSHVETDGTNTGASGFASNSSSNLTINNSYFHDSRYAHGATFWHTQNVTLNDVTSTNNRDFGFNFERVTGTVTINRPVLHNNGIGDIRIGTNDASARYNIYDPVYSGSKLIIQLTPLYGTAPNKQLRSDVHVYVHGVDRTNDVVQWKTRW